MVKKAVDGIQDLIDRTGGPEVKANVVVDQVYAEMQHEALEFKHPRGGRAKYLEAPMFEDHAAWLERFSQRLLVRATNTAREWGGVGRKLRDVVEKNAPVEFNDLRQSAALKVTEGGGVIIDEPAKQRRLTEQELHGKDMMRGTDHGYR